MLRRSSRLRASRSIEWTQNGVAVADETDHRVECGSVEVFAGHLAGEGSIENDAVELSSGAWLGTTLRTAVAQT